MKNDLKIKYLQYLSQKKQDSGFTLIELLVVIIIIGILSAIALPSFLGQASKAKEAEGVNNVGAVNRVQQAYRVEEGRFASELSDLELGLNTTNHYQYEINSGNDTSSNITATPTDTGTVRYVYGLIGLTGNGTTDSVICKANQLGEANEPTFDGTTAECSSTDTDEIQ